MSPGGQAERMLIKPTNRTELQVLPPSAPVQGEEERWGWGRAFWGLVWCEWYAHSRLLLLFLAAWLACVWVLPLYANPAWILCFGALFAVVAGPAYGGTDTSAGCEEFTFALPPTRSERYLTRLAVGGGALLLFTAMDLLALGMDLAQVLAKLYVDSGLIHPRPVLEPGLLYGLMVVLPVSVFAISFVISALTRSRAVVLAASLWAVLFSLVGLRLGLWYEEVVWETFNGWFTCPLLTILALGVLWAGWRAYCRKEIGHQAAPFAIPARWWLWLLLSVGALISAMALAASLARHYQHLFPGLPR